MSDNTTSALDIIRLKTNILMKNTQIGFKK
jgi:hypothetical protein